MSMDTMKMKLKEGMAKTEKKAKEEPAIKELIKRVFTTRNLVHFAHWDTTSYAAHMALGSLYEDIIEVVDDLVETYQGEFGVLTGLCTDCAESGGDVTTQIQDDANWIKANRRLIANGSTVIENLIDGVLGAYNKTLYKIKNLR